MKILLDENIHRKLKFDFDSDIEIITIQEINWQGKKNGDLLTLMILSGFTGLITADKNLEYQQN